MPQGSVLGPLLFGMYMDHIQTLSGRLNLILYADDMTLTSTLCKFTQEVNHDVNHISYLINLVLSKISDRFAVDTASLNVVKKNSRFSITTQIDTNSRYLSLTRSPDMLHLYHTHTSGARMVVIHRIPEL